MPSAIASAGLRKLGAARAYQAGESHDLAAAHLERNIMHTGGAACDVAQREHRIAGRHGTLRENGRELASDHQTDQFGAVHLCHAARADGLAVTQDSHAIGDGRDLLQPVRDVNDARALPSQQRSPGRGCQPRDR